MEYGQPSNSAEYDDDSYFEPAGKEKEGDAQPDSVPAFDPGKFVPKEQYEQLEQWKRQVEPKLGVLDRLQKAFESEQNGGVSPEQKAQLEQFVQGVRTAVNPELEALKTEQQHIVNNYLETAAKELGFENRWEAEDWYFVVQRNLENAFVTKGDQQAGAFSKQMYDFYTNNQHLPLMQFARQHFDYLNNFAGKMKITPPVRSQVVGQSFVNSPFNRQTLQSPADYSQALAKARQDGNQAEVQRLLGEMEQFVRLQFGY